VAVWAATQQPRGLASATAKERSDENTHKQLLFDGRQNEGGPDNIQSTVRP